MSKDELPHLSGSTSIRDRTWIAVAVTTAFIILACSLSLPALSRVRTDTLRLVEEYEEAQAARVVLASLASLRHEMILHRLDGLGGSADDRSVVPLAFESVRDALAGSSRGSVAVDPSDPAHQAKEDDLVARIATELDEAETLWNNGDLPTLQLGRALDAAIEMAEEMEQEALLSQADLERQIQLLDTILLLLSASAFAMLIAGAFFVHASIVSPILQLSRGVARFGSGDYAHRLEVTGPVEIEQLATTFNRMADQVQASHEVLEERVEERTRAVLHASRFAGLGALAAGAAHEINTPLASIASCAEGLLRRIREGTAGREEQEEYLTIMSTEAYRVRDITQELLSLSRKDPPRTELIDLGNLTQRVRLMFQPRADRRGISLRLDEPEPKTVMSGNPAEIQQVLINLLANALDACIEGGEITVKVETRPGGEAVLEVADDGPGVEQSAITRIFDPFFTTKPVGEGTGLGLAVTSWIVDRHEGTIEVENRPTGGALFRVHFPARRGHDA